MWNPLGRAEKALIRGFLVCYPDGRLHQKYMQLNQSKIFFTSLIEMNELIP